ncbi:hypothetical protein VSDG_01673 [Cytospora chrysosperma]|uniref:Mid2 domain-containing protein n=1 Tax=Cytospora chrysosperma TaxID=252740 RepID=A0A423WHN4_CYTCH|nr:hypothetical protein VSDG_01673 [Valsa sordida]
MKSVLGLAAIGCSIALVEAGSFKWNANNDERRWAPAYETLGVMPLLGSSPAPTSPPNLAEARQYKRATTDNTCAYISGDPEQPLYCNPDSACVYNSIYSNIGCCPDTSSSCPIWTTCLDSTDASLYTTDNGYTLWCGETQYPNCITHLYQDAVFTGFTLYGCAVAAGTDEVVYSATLSASSSSGESSSSASSLQTSLDAASTTTTSTRTSSSISDSFASSPTSSASTPATKSQGSSTPIGAIVGGVVGGVAVIALFALGLVFLLRKKRRAAGGRPNAEQPPMDQPGGYPPQPPQGQPPMQQYQQSSFQPPVDPATGYAAGAHGLDNRSSIQKPGYNYNATQSMHDSSMGSPPGSPPPQSQSPGSMLPAYQVSNTSSYAMTPQSETAYGAPQNQATGPGAAPAHQNSAQPVYQQQSGGNYYEMPTEPADRELRELA